jgi:hypothetical protein
MADSTRFRSTYGAGPLHLVVMLGCFTLLGSVLAVWGLSSLWDTEVWWHSVLVWFLGAVVLHDLVLFPLYALADRFLGGAVSAVSARGPGGTFRVSPLNYVRVPAMAVGLLFLLFLPGILQQGAGAHLRATGMTQEPFLVRWVSLSAAIFAVSGVTYAVRLMLAKREPERRETTEDLSGQPPAFGTS